MEGREISQDRSPSAGGEAKEESGPEASSPSSERPDKEVAVELPIEENDLNAQTT